MVSKYDESVRCLNNEKGIQSAYIWINLRVIFHDTIVADLTQIPGHAFVTDVKSVFLCMEEY